MLVLGRVSSRNDQETGVDSSVLAGFPGYSSPVGWSNVARGTGGKGMDRNGEKCEHYGILEER